MSFRRIDLADRPRVAATPEERPALIWAPISKIVIDDDYQRPLTDGSWRAIRRIAEAFTWTRFTPCLIAPVGDGHYALIDGQHRTHAALLAGHDMVPAMVALADTQAQARAFASVNGLATAVTPHHIFKAALAAGDDWAVRADRAVANAGARLMRSNGSTINKKAGEVFAVALIRDHIMSGRDEMVTTALRAIMQSEDGAADPWFWSNAVLRPWMAALTSVPQVKAATLPAFLNQADLRRLDIGVGKMRDQPQYARRPHGALFSEILTGMLKRWSVRVEPMA